MSQPVVYSMRFVGRMQRVAKGVYRRWEIQVPGGARLASEVLVARESTFREHGVVTFGSGGEVQFRTLGVGHLTKSGDGRFRHGTVVWELSGGSGVFTCATGRISSNFAISRAGTVEDGHVGLLFIDTTRGTQPCDDPERASTPVTPLSPPPSRSPAW